MHIQIVAPDGPCCFNQTRPPRPPLTKRARGPIEEGWINFQPYFKAPVAVHTRPTVNTTKPLNILERFASRVAEWRAIEATQNLELETVAQELARTGISSSSLDQNRTDDEYGPTLTDTIGPRDPVPYVAPDPNLVRRIQWERDTLACGQTTCYRLVRNLKTNNTEVVGFRNGEPIRRDDPANADTPEVARRLVAAMKGRTLDGLFNARARVAFYKSIGSLLYGVATGDHPTSSLLAPTEALLPDGEDGPKELGQDTVLIPNEPTETDLWPVTLDEVALTIFRGFQLGIPERRWLAQNWDEVHAQLQETLTNLRQRFPDRERERRVMGVEV